MYIKEHNLISVLLENNRFTTNAEIQKALNISRRTVINYIKNINSTYDGLIISSEKGYMLTDRKKAIEIIKETKSQKSLDGYENRKIHILQKLVFNSDIVNIDDLSDELCISSYTLKKDISHLQTELKEHNLFIKTKNNNIYIIGKEKEKKDYIIDLLSKEIEEQRFNIQFIQDMFIYADVDEIYQIITACLDQHNFFVDDFSLFNYVLHLAICIETSTNISSKLDVSEHINYEQYYPEQVKDIIVDIYNHLKEAFDIHLSFEQICESSLVMVTRIVSKDYTQLSFDQLKPILGYETIELVNQIVQSVYDIYKINLRNDNFLVRFSFHIKNLLVRSKIEADIPSNQFITIKDDYPFLYFVAIYIASIITQYTKFPLSDAEISYIALHLGVLMEETKVHEQNINCVIVLYDYYNAGKMMFHEINEQINSLYLLNIVSSYKQIHNYQDIDLIITTLPIDLSYEIPMVKVNMIPSQSDIHKIASIVSDIKDKKRSREIENDIRRLFKENLFNIRSDFSNRNEVIDILCDCMTDYQYVDDNFKEAIISREKLASSAYSNTAIPHPINIDQDSIKESSIAVVINNNPVQWGEDQIDYIFLLALRNEDRGRFKDIFDIIIHLLLDIPSIDLHQYQEYNSFINLLVTHCCKIN